MQQYQRTLTIATHGQGLYEITNDVMDWTTDQNIGAGLLTVFCRHTSASLTIQENADADVQRDLNDFFRKLVVEDTRLYHHKMEGPDDMPAHVKASLLGSSLTIPISAGRLTLGTWQGIFLCEHRDRASGRHLVLTLTGQTS